MGPVFDGFSSLSKQTEINMSHVYVRLFIGNASRNEGQKKEKKHVPDLNMDLSVLMLKCSSAMLHPSKLPQHAVGN